MTTGCCVDVLVSAANSLTQIKRNLVYIPIHLQGSKVQLLFGHCEWKQDLYSLFARCGFRGYQH